MFELLIIVTAIAVIAITLAIYFGIKYNDCARKNVNLAEIAERLLVKNTLLFKEMTDVTNITFEDIPTLICEEDLSKRQDMTIDVLKKINETLFETSEKFKELDREKEGN